jgi:hypothetical protein
MAQCNFSIPVSITAEEVAATAKKAITDAGGSFNGNASAGNFEIGTPLGAISGSYVIQQSVIDVTISSKPLFISCDRIESQLRGYFDTIA